MNIHRKMKDQTGMARFYAEDGAYHTAAKVLRDLADDLEVHAAWADSVVTGLMVKEAGEPVEDELLDPARKGALEAQHRRDVTRKNVKRFPSPYSTEAGLRGGLGRDDLGYPINLQGSGPAPIEKREG